MTTATSLTGIKASAAEQVTRALMQQSAPTQDAPQLVPAVDQRRYVTAKDRERRKDQARAQAAYDGKFPDPLKTQDPDKPNLNVKVNRCSPIVDKGTSFLFGQPVGIEVTAPTGQKLPQSRLDALNEWLQQALGDEDDLMTTLTKIAMNGAIYGSAFVKVLPADPTGGFPFPTLRNLDPLYMSVVTEPDDVDTVLAYCFEYQTSDPTRPGVQITKRQIIERVDPDRLADVYGVSDADDHWMITNYERVQQAGGPSTVDAGNTTAAYVRAGLDTSADQGFQQVGEPVDWPYTFAPVFHCQNLPAANELWGKPDLSPDIIHVNEALNLVTSSVHSIGYSHGFPWLWTNSTLEGTKVAPGHVIELNDENGSLNALMANGDITGLMNHAESLRADQDEQSRVPAVALGRLAELPKGNISGVALQLLFQPLLEKTTLKQRLYGKLIRELCKALLVLGGQINDWHEVAIALHWKPIMPADDLQAAQVATALAALGFVSKETILIGLGIQPDAEQAKLDDEDAKAQAKAAKAAASAPPAAPQPPLPTASDGSTPAAQVANPAPAPNAPTNASAPPVNHPAAVAARAAMTAATKGL